MNFRNTLSRLLDTTSGPWPARTRHRRRRTERLHAELLELRQVLTTVDLATLTVAQGSAIFGADTGDNSGISVSSAGDVNGDGFDDLLIGAPGADAAGNAKSGAGDSYVIFGSASPPATVDLANLGAAGITIWGADSDDLSGRSVSSAGDVNGDGFDDLLIGADRADAAGDAKSSAGESYVIFGSASLPATIDLANLGTAGITIWGTDSDDRSGISVSSAGDVNGDGFDDLLIGAFLADAAGNAKPYAGDSYVIFGSASPPATIDLANLGTAGITIWGADAYDSSGISVSSAGDVNGDGFDDLLIGAGNADAAGNAKSYAGDSYVYFGSASPPATIDLANLGTAGITIWGADAYDSSGISVSSAGDVNGDGFDDLLIGANGADAAGNAKPYAGESYVIFGSASPTATIDLANLGSAGMTILGADSGDYSGFSVSSAGDVNGDGFDDLLIGAIGADAAGDSYVYFGSPSPPATIDLANLGTAGMTIFGADSYDQSGRSVSSAGDMNGDGFDDLLIGAYLADAAGNAKSYAGDSYVIFGGNFTASTTHLGTSAAETLTGTVSTDVMNGGRENDTLIGNGGADVLIGGQGSDILAVSDLTFRRIVGGTGSDTLRLGGTGMSLDLTTLKDNRLLGIEQIDLTGTGDNTLVLSVRDVLNLSDESNTLIVHGNSGDSIQLDSGWSPASSETINGLSYRVLKRGAATLKVALTVSGNFPTVIDLANLGTAQGSAIFGADTGDFSGISVSSAGDVNGDGFDDLIIGASLADAAGNAKSDAGDSYLIFGSASPPATIDLANLGTAGITIWGADAYDSSGSSVSSAGDVNGDGFDDLLIGAFLADAADDAKPYAGESYVIFGSASPPATIDLANLGTAGITIWGTDSDDRSGISVSSAGDVNGDGFDDLLIGAYLADAAGDAKPYAGESYVIFGSASPPVTIDLANLGTAGITIWGTDSDDRSGISVSSAGDVNGDGFDDLLIGANRADAAGNAKSSAGESYVIFGSASLPATIDLANLGTAGITIWGTDSDDRSGISVSSAGDVNGDGFDDLIIGAHRADAAGNAKSSAGESYVIFGSASLPATIDLANLGTAGITIWGADASDNSGISVSSAGDVNGDGFDDLLIGAPSADAADDAKPYAGESYVIFGSASPPATIDLANLGTAGMTIFGADSYDQSGRSVSSAGDVNGDGFDDLLIGAFLADAAGNAKSYAGESYVIFGGNFTASTTHLGTAAAETLTGSVSADVMSGGRENDTLIGNGGADVLIGGQGSDILAVSDLTFRRIVGGTGSDTLRLGGTGMSLDLTTLKDNRLLGIEQIDLTGTGDNTLVLSVRDVLNLSDESNTLIVHGNSGDSIQLDSGWSPAASETINGLSYRVLKRGAATLKVAPSIAGVPAFPDLTINKLTGFTANGTTTLSLTYDVVGVAAPTFSIGFYKSSDTQFGSDTLIKTVTISAAADLTLGPHTKTWSTGTAATAIPLPGAGTTDTADDYYLIAVLDPADAVAETDTIGTNEDNVSVFSGIYYPGSGAVMIHGREDAADTLTISSTMGVTLNSAATVTYSNAGSVRARLHDGDDTLSAAAVTKPVFAWGGSGADNLTTGTAADYLGGGDGNDTLTGNAAVDILEGMGGNDTLVGGAGKDTYRFNADTALGTDTITELSTGGTGDLLDFSTTQSTAVTVNLATATVQVVNANLSLVLGGNNLLEHVTGGGQGDSLTGNTLANILIGGPGNDTLTGGTGNDTYRFDADGALGSDTLVETVTSGGTDLLDFSLTTTLAVNVDLTVNTSQVINANLNLNLGNAGLFENVTGGSLNDLLVGNALTNTLTGGAGNDKLIGGAANDTLVGGAGNDTYSFAANTALGLDTLTEAAGAGDDLLDFSETTAVGVTVDLASTVNQVVNANLTIKLSNATGFEMVLGSANADTIRGNTLSNAIWGGAGVDTLYGFGARDLLFGGSGADRLEGGDDEDILIGGHVSYYNETTRILDRIAIDAIRAEWVKTTATYATRIANLRAGVGRGASAKLNSTTVTSDGTDAVALDTLFGQNGLDWFWTFGSDSIGDLNTGGTETVN